MDKIFNPNSIAVIGVSERRTNMGRSIVANLLDFGYGGEIHTVGQRGGIVFGHPADGGDVIARHPVQLYEALFYFLFFGVLWALRKKVPKMFLLGKTSGLFFIATFSFRFLIEFLKAHQSALVAHSALLDMGQLLSLPMILVGLVLFFSEEYSLRSRPVKGEQG